jgi:uncharacterized membrane protein
MKSKASIGNHPLHPMLVPIPIGAFFLVLAGDIAHLFTADPFWYRFSAVAIVIGIAFALLAAVVGAVDYLSLPMSPRASGLATWHALANVSAVALYAVSAVVRQSGAMLRSGRWWAAVAFSTLGFLLLAAAGWLGGKLAYEERVGVLEEPATALEIEDEEAEAESRRFLRSR